MNLPTTLFCQDLLNKKNPEPEFAGEYEAAKKNGFQVLLFDFDLFARDGEIAFGNISAPATKSKIIYRGWMMRPDTYKTLYEILVQKNYELINSPQQYKNCHYLPESFHVIEGQTAKSIFIKHTGEESIQKIIEAASVFGNKPLIIKDYVKSEKHHWESACFVPDASDKKKLRQSIMNFIELRGKELNEGIVLREFLELKDLTSHSKSGMPLKEEYRLFFVNRKLLGAYDYWEEGEYTGAKPETKEFENLAKKIDSQFFTVDIARKKTGGLIVMELGDGQVSGIPERANKFEFYEKLKQQLI